MNVEMLEKGIALLVEDANNPTGIKFDFSWYGGPAGEVVDEAHMYSCHTSACAMGLFAIKRLGEGKGFSEVKAFFQGHRHRELSVMVDGNVCSFAGYGRELFDIDKDQYEALFIDSYGLGNGKQQGRDGELRVARRIEWFIECGDDMKKFLAGMEDAMKLPLQKEYKV